MLNIISQYLTEHGYTINHQNKTNAHTYTYDDYIHITDNDHRNETSQTAYATIYHHTKDNTYTLYDNWLNNTLTIDLQNPNSLQQLLTTLHHIKLQHQCSKSSTNT